MSNNQWLFEQLTATVGLELDPDYSQLISVRHPKRIYRIYCPTSAEYIVTIDVVERVIEMGGDTISYATTWCRVSEEAKGFAKDRGVSIHPHGATLNMLRV